MALSDGDIDLFDRTVVGWVLSTSLKANHTSLKALEMALTTVYKSKVLGIRMGF